MPEIVSIVRSFHETRRFDSREDRDRQTERVVGLYRSLNLDDAGELARAAIDSFDPHRTGVTEEILACLACFRPGRLVDYHMSLIDRRIFYPGVVFSGASSDVAQRILELIPNAIHHEGPVTARNMLRALAWVGGDRVESAFGEWRQNPPSWADAEVFGVPPYRYAEEAGWELDSGGGRRNLLLPECHALIKPREEGTVSEAVSCVLEHDETCRWCHRPMTTLLEIDLSHPATTFLGIGGDRLRIATCDVCTCFGYVFSSVDWQSATTWHRSNRRPKYLPEAPAELDRLPTRCLELQVTPRPLLESARWLLPGVRFSQLGGFPTWVQYPDYPRCPQCDRSMPFFAQLDNGDIQEYAEGIYYAFLCRECRVGATTYQQT